MRALAAVRMRQASEAVRASRRYAAAIGDALASARDLLPAEPPPPATVPGLVIVFCTEHGFAGAFNDHLIDRAADGPRRPLIVVGSRGATLAAERRLEVAATFAAASHPSGVVAVARRVSTELYARVNGDGITHIDAIYGHGDAIGAPTIVRDRLLPVDRAALVRSAAFAPLHHLEPRALVQQLVTELVLADLIRMAMESLVAENSARMQAMSAARDNIERKLVQLEQAEHRGRQDEVTTELLDLITGAEALK
jgi:F-type H+-transporting ATPase subunit gamma